MMKLVARVRDLALACGGGIVAVALFAQVTKPAEPRENVRFAENLRVQRLTIEDTNHRTRLVLSVEADNSASIQMLDTQGKSLMRLESGSGSASIRIGSEKGPRIFLLSDNVGILGPGIAMSFNQNRAGLKLGNLQGWDVAPEPISEPEEWGLAVYAPYQAKPLAAVFGLSEPRRSRYTGVLIGNEAGKK